MMRKIFVLDTSALIYNPSVYKQFPNSDVVIPIAVLNELDKLKKQSGEVGKNARVSIRLLDEISLLGDISVGISIDDDILVKIDATYIDTTVAPYLGLGDPDYGDTQILACLQLTWHNNTDNDVCLISNDINLRVKARSRGIRAESRETDRSSLEELYSGMQTIVHEDAGGDLLENEFIDPRNYNLKLSLHECVVFTSDDNDIIAVGRKTAHNKVKIIKKQYPWNLSSRNIEQSCAIDLIMDPNVDLLTFIGKAGSGKSLVALACALELVLSKKQYDKLVIYRPIQSVGNEIGFVPGSIEEKLAPWFQAIMDSFEVLFSNKGGNDWIRDLEMYQKKGKIELGAITYVRGRSLPNSIILIDEAQNLSKEDIKTLLTRAGEGTKVILTGDIEQIDAKDLDAVNNGLTNVIERFKDSELSGHVTFTKGERSRLATKAAEIL